MKNYSPDDLQDVAEGIYPISKAIIELFRKGNWPIVCCEAAMLELVATSFRVRNVSYEKYCDVMNSAIEGFEEMWHDYETD